MELTPVKDALRAWIEPQLASLPPFLLTSDGAISSTGEAALAGKMNAALQANGLTCDGGPRTKPRCSEEVGDFDSRGYVDGVSLSFLEDNRYLLVETSVGINCGEDQSAYVYEWAGKKWHLLLSSEQDDYRKGKYQPQTILSVEATPSKVAWNEPEKTPPMILTLGYSPWCSSNWRGLYARLWRTTPTNAVPKPLLDLSPSVYIGDEPAIAAASLTDHDILIEYTDRSIDEDRFTRKHVLHYVIGEQDELNRVAPVALDPADFVDEWLTAPWKEAGDWSVSSASMANYHLRHHVDFIFGSFSGDATRCAKDPTLWEVGFQPGTDDNKKIKQEETSYFLVRWLAPYRFTLMDIRSSPYAHCDIIDKMPDAIGTLFPLQDWRR